MTSQDSFQSRVTIHAGGRQVEIHRLDALTRAGFQGIDTLPYSIRVLLENLLRFEDGKTVTRQDIEAVANWDPKAKPSTANAILRARPARPPSCTINTRLDFLLVRFQRLLGLRRCCKAFQLHQTCVSFLSLSR